MNVIWLLAIFTLLAVGGVGGYMFLSHRRLEKHGGQAKGIGGVNDPMSGARPLDRSPEDMADAVRSKE